MPPKKKKLKNALNNVLAQSEAIKREKRLMQQQQNSNAQAQRKERQRIGAHRRMRPEFREGDRILLVGEGNFSFARSLAENYLQENWNKMVATCYDSEDILYEKYGDEAKENIEILRAFGVHILFDVDATKLQERKMLRKNVFTKIIFNFPHAGAGIKDQDHNVRANQALINGFLASARQQLSMEGQLARFYTEQTESDDNQQEEALTPLREGEIHITIKTCKPYDLWDIKSLAKSTGELAVKSSFRFLPEDFPGYEHRRTLGFKEGVSKGGNAEIIKAEPKTFVIVRRSAMAEEFEKSKKGSIEAKKERQREKQLGKKKRKRVENDNDDDSDDDQK